MAIGENNPRSLAKDIRLGIFGGRKNGVHFSPCTSVFIVKNTEKIRIINVRTKQNIVQVRCLNDGKWLDLNGEIVEYNR